MQVKEIHHEIDALHNLYGDSSLCSVYGAGCIDKPKVMLIFMNPTAKNVSAQKSWKGMRAPWLGTKNIWSLLRDLHFISEKHFKITQTLQPHEWSLSVCEDIYIELQKKGVYVTNLAKCTQLDARPLKDDVFRKYVEVMKREIALIKPQHIITFGNQVSSILLGQQVSVSKYSGSQKEDLVIDGQTYHIYPTYYPVGHGRMNQPKAIKRIQSIVRT